MARSNLKDGDTSDSRGFNLTELSDKNSAVSKARYSKLKQEVSAVQQAFDFANFAIISFDIQGEVVTFNKTFKELFDFSNLLSPEDVTPEFIRQWLEKNSKNPEAILISGYKKLKDFRKPIVSILELKDGRFIRGTSKAVMVDDMVTAIVWSLVDITELKKSERIAKHHANHDSLTSLPNRYHFFEKLEASIEETQMLGENLAVLFMDLDNFKEINDTFGHHIGDQFLVEVANRISSSLRIQDTLARFGGDEFVVILNKISSRELITSITQRIQDTFNQSFVINEHTIESSISIGIAVYPDDSPTGQTLMKFADRAMYHVKQNGRNAHCFFDQMSS